MTFFKDGSKLMYNPYSYYLAPGASVKVIVGVGFCTRVGSAPYCIGKKGNYDFDMFVHAYSQGASVANKIPVVARQRLKFNMGSPAMDIQSNANVPPTNLENNQSVTYNFVNTDVEALPLGVAFFNYFPNTGSVALNQFLISGTTKNLKTGVTEYYGVNGLDGYVTATNCTHTEGSNLTLFVGATLKPGQSCYVRHSCLTDLDTGKSARAWAFSALQSNASSSKFVFEGASRVSTRKPSEYIAYLPDRYNPNGNYPGFADVTFYPQINGQSLGTTSLKCTLK